RHENRHQAIFVEPLAKSLSAPLGSKLVEIELPTLPRDAVKNYIADQRAGDSGGHSEYGHRWVRNNHGNQQSIYATRQRNPRRIKRGKYKDTEWSPGDQVSDKFFHEGEAF